MLTYSFTSNKFHPISIVGTFLLISSLKDPCQKNCFSMLLKFKEELPTILQSLFSTPGILLPNNFTRIILISAKELHREVDHLGEQTIRDQLDTTSPSFNLRIKIDFDNPQAKVFSARFADL